MSLIPDLTSSKPDQGFVMILHYEFSSYLILETLNGYKSNPISSSSHLVFSAPKTKSDQP